MNDEQDRPIEFDFDGFGYRKDVFRTRPHLAPAFARPPALEKGDGLHGLYR
jgi:hypothetical protein